jgi:hypothetical protein
MILSRKATFLSQSGRDAFGRVKAIGGMGIYRQESSVALREQRELGFGVQLGNLHID